MTGGIFGCSSTTSPATTTATPGGLFGCSSTTSTTTATPGRLFGGPSTTSAFTYFGQPTTIPGRFLGPPPTTASAFTGFGRLAAGYGQPTTTTTATPTTTTTADDVTASPLGPFFGATPAVRIGGSASIASLGGLTTTNFGQTATHFGQTATPTTKAATSGLFSGVTAATTPTGFGGFGETPTRPTTTNFGGIASGFGETPSTRPATTAPETRPCTTIPYTSCFDSNQTGLGICDPVQPSSSAALQSPIGTRLNEPFKRHNQLTNEIILRITPFIENFTLDCHNVPSSCTINIKLNMDTGKIFSIEYEKNNSDQQDLLKQLKVISSQLDLIKFDLKNKDQNSAATKINNKRANEI